MDCREYIVGFLTADADDELDARERKIAREHLRRCAACRARLANERALKALIHEHSPRAKAPADVRLRIRAALGEINSCPARHAAAAPVARVSPARAGGARNRLAHAFRATRRLYVAAPAIAAASIVLIVLFAGGTRRPVQTARRSVPQFDLAIREFARMADDFVPNVPVDAFNSKDGIYYAWVVGNSNRPPDERLDVSRSYSELNMPADLYNFDDSGYSVVGGRFDHLADGRAISYTLYRGPDGALMNICIRNPRMEIPVDAVYWLGMHSFYSYKHYSLCVTSDPAGRFVSILVTRQRLLNLVRDVMLADIEITAQR